MMAANGKVVVSEVTMILTGGLYAEVKLQVELEFAAPPRRCVLRLLSLLDLFAVVLQVRL
jgi:hypothetical protein